MASEVLRFGSAAAAPGRKAFGQLRVREKGKETSLPVCVVNGARPGRHVVVLANQHGTELNGIESVRRFCEAVDPRRMRGTVCAVISANPRAALAGQPVWTEGDAGAEVAYSGPYNMNYVWPGRRGGKVVERAAHEIWTQAIVAPHRKADFVLDLHSHQNATAVYADDYGIAALGVVSGIRNIVVTGRSDKVNTVNLACFREGIPCMTAELSMQGGFNGESVDCGITAIRNLLIFHGLLSGRLRLGDEAIILDPWRNDLVKDCVFAAPSYRDCFARHDGLVVPFKNTYDLVRKGERIGHVVDPFTGKVVEECRAPMSGAIYNWRTVGAVCAAGGKVATMAIARRVKPADYVRGMER